MVSLRMLKEFADRQYTEIVETLALYLAILVDGKDEDEDDEDSPILCNCGEDGGDNWLKVTMYSA